MYNFKKERDSFCSTRKIYSIRILGNILCYYDYPDGFKLIIDTLNKKNGKVLSECFDTLKIYYTNRNIKPSKKIVNKLYEIVEKTKMKSIAVGALDVLVSTSIISELEALTIIDDWKSKNYKYGYF